MLLDRAGLGSQSLPDLGTVPSKRPPKLKKKKACDSSGPAGLAVSSCHHKVNMARLLQGASPSKATQQPGSTPGRQLRNRLEERGDQEHSLPPKRTSTRLRSQVITYRHRGTRAGLSSQGHAGASAEAGGVTQVRVAVAARSPQALLGSALPGNLELHDPPQVGASRPRTSHTGFVL